MSRAGAAGLGTGEWAVVERITPVLPDWRWVLFNGGEEATSAMLRISATASTMRAAAPKAIEPPAR